MEYRHRAFVVHGIGPNTLNKTVDPRPGQFHTMVELEHEIIQPLLPTNSQSAAGPLGLKGLSNRTRVSRPTFFDLLTP
jgi:hypothetical protein